MDGVYAQNTKLIPKKRICVGYLMKEYTEVHQKGNIEISYEALGLEEVKTLVDRDFGVQISMDGRVWICIDGIAFIRFKPTNSLLSWKLK